MTRLQQGGKWSGWPFPAEGSQGSDRRKDICLLSVPESGKRGREFLCPGGAQLVNEEVDHRVSFQLGQGSCSWVPHWPPSSRGPSCNSRCQGTGWGWDSPNEGQASSSDPSAQSRYPSQTQVSITQAPPLQR